MRTVIGIDIGTTHIKSILFDEDGRPLSEEKAETPVRQDGTGSIYRPEEIWRIVSGQLKSHLLTGKGTTAGISITGMAEAGLIINRRTGKEETDIIPWFDRRTCALAEGMSVEREREIFAYTGLRNSFKYGIYKFLWLLSEQGMDKEDAVWLSMCDYIAWKLTGRFVTEPGFAARTYVYDIRTGGWDLERIKEYGLCEENFPKVLPSGCICGRYRTQEGREVPVAIAGHDHVCAAFGLLYHNKNGICDSAGTSETYIGRLQTENPVFDREDGMLYGPFADGGYFYMANVPSSGHSIEWFRKNLQIGELSYEEMNERLLCLPAGPTGILYFPWLTGMGSPCYEASAKGAILGIEAGMDGFRVLKGMTEGIQYQAAWLLSMLAKRHGIAAEHVMCAGGSVHNRTMMQIKADILQKTIQIPEAPEATLTGAAALFLQKNSREEAAERFLDASLTVKEIYIPDRERSRKYEAIWKERFLPMAELLTGFYRKNGGNENV